MSSRNRWQAASAQLPDSLLSGNESHYSGAERRASDYLAERLMRTTGKKFDVLVVGGGPAGLAAASSAAEHGVRVGLVDDNPALGGQIWRQGIASVNPEAESWVRKVRSAGGEVLL